ncbi:hypothetical protein [Pseudomonas putida]|uniref:hypothetical protein n=1 Tax=Pseudomonas TaxID=286 RepID=UPI00159DF113|nr:hypothetical protein [Pseudomonas putida]
MRNSVNYEYRSSLALAVMNEMALRHLLPMHQNYQERSQDTVVNVLHSAYAWDTCDAGLVGEGVHTLPEAVDFRICLAGVLDQ